MNTSRTTERTSNVPSEAPLAELIKQLSEQSSQLARQEVELAKAELAVKAKRAGIGAGMFGGAGAFGFYGLGALIAAAILALSTAVTAWLAALIVAVVLASIAGLLALVGKHEVEEATPPVPKQATESVKEDVQFAKTRAQEARR
ncbi:MAG TPA: phage holin family protein [Solirubrobacteraceae bacterium]|nr:phage holin family protein [Solirubrobacteraceae bacterium]